MLNNMTCSERFGHVLTCQQHDKPPGLQNAVHAHGAQCCHNHGCVASMSLKAIQEFEAHELGCFASLHFSQCVTGTTVTECHSRPDAGNAVSHLEKTKPSLHNNSFCTVDGLLLILLYTQPKCCITRLDHKAPQRESLASVACTYTTLHLMSCCSQQDI